MGKKLRVVHLILALFLLLPFAGLYTISDAILNVYNLSINSVYELRQVYPIYLLCFFIGFLIPHSLRIGMISEGQSLPFSQAQLHRLRPVITIFLLLAALLVFQLVGKDILTGATHRGAVRVSFGGFGFLYKTLVQFWVPVALAISGMAYRVAIKSGLAYGFPFFHLFLTILTLSMMGYKSGVIVGTLPFLFIIVPLLKLRNQLFLAIGLIVILTLYSSIILNTDNLGATMQYLFIRGTQGTAWGLIACWDLFENPHPNAWLSLLPIFGTKITALLLDISPGSIEYMMLGSGQYVTYLVHPNPSIVLAGETNLTVTLAGEAVYLAGRSTFWLLAFPVGFIIGLLCKMLSLSINNNNMLMAPLLSIAMTTIILPLLNSGGVYSLFSATTVFYMLATLLFIKLLYTMLKGARAHP